MVLIYLPVFYILAGAIYGTIAIVKRWFLHRDFLRLSPADKELLSREYRRDRLSARQWVSMVSSLVLLICLLLMVFSLSAPGALIPITLMVASLIPPLVIVTNVSSVWDRHQVYLEETGLAQKDKLMGIYYYLGLIPLWLVGTIGSIVAIFIYFEGTVESFQNL